MTEPQTAVETYLAARDDLGSTAGSILALHRQDLTEARHAALAEVAELREAARTVINAWSQPIDSYTRPTQDIGSALTLHMGPKIRALRAILDAAETP